MTETAIPRPAVAPDLFVHVADAEQAQAHFGGRLAFETDASDVHAAMASGTPGFVLVDTRSDAAWAQGRLPGAVHLPTRRIPDGIAALAAPGTPVVVYCWSPGCNGATKAALELARLGYPVKEMIGGFEYWVREGFAFTTDDGIVQPEIDPRVNASAGPVSWALATGDDGFAAACAC